MNSLTLRLLLASTTFQSDNQADNVLAYFSTSENFYFEAFFDLKTLCSKRTLTLAATFKFIVWEHTETSSLSSTRR